METTANGKKRKVEIKKDHELINWLNNTYPLIRAEMEFLTKTHCDDLLDSTKDNPELLFESFNIFNKAIQDNPPEPPLKYIKKLDIRSRYMARSLN